MTDRPKVIDDPLYQLLRHEEIDTFNERKQAGETCDMQNCDFRGLDLRKIDAKGLDWHNGYFRGTDLRGVDLQETNLEGASIANAKVSGALFPRKISASEIMLSLTHGTRMRYNIED
jgi:uncharacterized protein YjbI with pentapeptide repeats